VTPLLELSTDTRRTGGVLLLTVLAIEWGGWYLLRVARGKVTRTPLQQRMERAGHAHAGVLVILALVGLVYADAVALPTWLSPIARNGVPVAAILMPAGFFLSVAGPAVTRPNPLVLLVYAGMVSLGLGVASLGIGLLLA
jgi:hypothetical protein